MSGNVSEWCWDKLGAYPNENETDPTGTDTMFGRILRGGNWLHILEHNRFVREEPLQINETFREYI